MRLPERLDYDETQYDYTDDSEWYPLVRCTVPGCSWTYHAAWYELGDDGDADWDALHPAHNAVAADA